MQNVTRKFSREKFGILNRKQLPNLFFNSLKKASCASVEGSALIDHLKGKTVIDLIEARKTYIALIFFALEGFLASGPWNIFVLDHVLQNRSKLIFKGYDTIFDPKLELAFHRNNKEHDEIHD